MKTASPVFSRVLAPLFFINWSHFDFFNSLLGEIKANEAVPILFDNINLCKEKKPSLPLIRDDCPCLFALIAIGKPSSKMAINNLVKEDESSKINKMLFLLYAVEGKKVALFLLNEKLKSTADPDKDRLLKAIKHFRNYYR